MIGFEQVEFRYGEKIVLRGASLALPTHGAVCLFGPSGCGKTTALHILAGLHKPCEGEVFAPAAVSIVFQEDRLLPWMDALGNARLPSGSDGAEKLLERLGIEDIQGRPVARMSGGQKRRVAIARALAAHSELLLLDEPFRGLDEAARAIAARLVLEKIAHIPCVLVTHDREEAALLGAPILPMQHGKIGEPEPHPAHR